MILMIISSLSGILLDDGGNPYTFLSLRGENVEIYGGEGIYQYESVFKAVLFQGFDWANLGVGLLVFIWGIVSFKRGKVKGQLLVAAFFSYLTYNYLIGVMGNAFNGLFLVWTSLFSVGLFGLILTLRDLDLSTFTKQLKSKFPRRSLSVYMLILGLFLLIQYLVEILQAYGTGTIPASLDVYTTLELAALELGIMIPLHFIGGILLWKEKVAGYLTAIILLFTALMTFISLSVSSVLFFIHFERGTPVDMIIPIVLVIVASVYSVVVFRNIRD